MFILNASFIYLFIFNHFFNYFLLMDRKTAWSLEDAMSFLRSVGFEMVEPTSLKPVYAKRLYTMGVNHWCVPCWEFNVWGHKKYLRMDKAEILKLRPDKITPILPSQGVHFPDSVSFKFLKRNNGVYSWRDVDDPAMAGNQLWEEIIAPNC